jgi:myo-inositol-1(or 4)-monophosphatase
MHDKNLKEYCDFMHILAEAAAAVTLPHFRKDVKTINKGPKLNSDFDPVTIADQNAEKAIRKLISQKYPDHDILGEEGGEEIHGNNGNWTERWKWVIDPIDGTRSYITGIPLWGTLVALHDGERPQVGMLDQPYLKERYIGTRHYSTLNGVQIKTRNCETLSDAIISTTCPAQFFETENDRKAFERVAAQTKLMRHGYDCYAYVMLACGHMDLVIESGLEPYDIQALIPIIKGAGGIITSWEGGPADQGGRVIAAATQKLHAQAMALLNQEDSSVI